MGRKISNEDVAGSLTELLDDIDSISPELVKVGLTNYEARCYLASVALAVGRAEEIAELARIPRTSAYKSLESLADRGFMERSSDRPRRYRPADPMAILGMLRGDIESTFEKIARIQESQRTRGVPQVIYTLNGKDRVMRKIGDMLDRASNRFVISSPNISEIRKNHRKAFEKAFERDVELLVIAPPFVKIPKCTNAVRRRSLIATDVVMDSDEALIASPDLSACGFTDNALLAGHLEGFLEIVMSEGWERAE